MLISCENCQSFIFMVYIFCEQHVCTKVHMHVHPTNSKWQLIHQRMSSFKSSVLYLSADFPFLSLHAYLLSDPPLCVVYTLHLLFSSLFSFPLYLFYMSGKKSLSFDFYFPLPSSSNLVTRRWQVRKRKGACEKWGLYSCCSTLSSSYMPPLLPEGWVCRTYLREKESGKKAQRRSERWYRTAGNKNRRERVRKWCFFLKGCQAMSSERKEGTWGERKNAEVSDLFISLKKVTVVYQLTIHSSYCTSLSPSVCYSVFHPIFLPLSPLERAFRSGLANLL